MSSNPFQYQPLDESKQEIRLLSLPPQAVDGTICLQLGTAPLADIRNQYDAISYAWGDPPATYPIQVNGKKFYVRENIFKFLRHYLRLMSREPSKMWIDCICINQEDNDEKSWQVADMTEIFRSAKRVLMWLGDASEEITLQDLYSVHFPRSYRRPNMTGHGINYVVKTLEFQLRVARTRLQDFCFEKFYIGRRLCLYSVGESCTAACSCSIFTKHRFSKGSDWKSCSDERAKWILGTLLESTYWQRLWIVQEFLAAKEALIVMGDAMIALDTLRRAIKIREFKQSQQSSRLLHYIFTTKSGIKFSGGALRRLIYDCRLQ